jgi:hypothetical protein
LQRKNKRYLWLVKKIEEHQSDKCLLWPFQVDKDGYGRVRPGGKRITYGAHRVAFLLANGHWPTPCGLHSCDTPRCVNPRHIWEGSSADNNADRAKKGRGLIGIRQPDAKLTDEIVRQARIEYIPRKLGFHRLAKKYGVSKPAMMSAIKRKTWRHVL